MGFVNLEGGDSTLSETLLATDWYGIILQKYLIFDICIFCHLFFIFTVLYLFLYSSLFIPYFVIYRIYSRNSRTMDG